MLIAKLACSIIIADHVREYTKKTRQRQIAPTTHVNLHQESWLESGHEGLLPWWMSYMEQR